MDFVNRYRDNQSSSDDDSVDSDEECTVWKRATAVKRIAEDENVSNAPGEQLNETCNNTKRKRNTIWTEVLQDQLISDDLEGCLLKNKPAHYESRGKESYDYTLKYKDPRLLNNAECHMEQEHCGKERNSLHPHNKTKIKKFVKLDSAELGAARKIIKILNEKKVYLIQRIVKFVGIEKAMTLLSMTEQIEESGGMMIKNNARRRTPGGVYLQLLKSDKDVTQEILDKIFEGEMSCLELKKYYAEKKKKRKQYHKEKKGKLSEDSSPDNMESKKTDHHDMVMDAEESNFTNLTGSSPKNNSVSVPVPKISSENGSDLEEGEIED